MKTLYYHSCKMYILRYDFRVSVTWTVYISVSYIFVCVYTCIYILTANKLVYVSRKSKHPPDCTKLFGLNIDL